MALELATQAAPQAPGETLRLEVPLTIHHAAELHRMLVDALDAGAGGIDLAAVEQCDSAGVQLLLSAERTLAPGGTPLRLFNATAPVLDILGRYGLLPDAGPSGGKP